MHPETHAINIRLSWIIQMQLGVHGQRPCRQQSACLLRTVLVGPLMAVAGCDAVRMDGDSRRQSIVCALHAWHTHCLSAGGESHDKCPDSRLCCAIKIVTDAYTAMFGVVLMHTVQLQALLRTVFHACPCIVTCHTHLHSVHMWSHVSSVAITRARKKGGKESPPAPESLPTLHGRAVQ